MGCLPLIAIVVWWIEWTQHRTPYLLHAWNPWNISLIVIVALIMLGGREVRSDAEKFRRH